MSTENKQTIITYVVYQYDIHFSYSSRVCFGYFTSKEIAFEQMIKGFDKLYKGFEKDVYHNGRDQYICDKHDFGAMIEEIEINNLFCEC